MLKIKNLSKTFYKGMEEENKVFDNYEKVEFCFFAYLCIHKITI